jgi:hypothetical protein
VVTPQGAFFGADLRLCGVSSYYPGGLGWAILDPCPNTVLERTPWEVCLATRGPLQSPRGQVRPLVLFMARQKTNLRRQMPELGLFLESVPLASMGSAKRS